MAKYEPHSFTRKVLNWRYCAHCGLIRLKNEATEWAVKKGCNWRESGR